METKFRKATTLVLSLNLLVAVAAVIICESGGKNHFRESGFVTWFSTAQLLVISWLNHRIFKIRSLDRKGSPWTHFSAVWLLLSLGFLFLAMDEQFKIHENVDELIHETFEIKETNLTDRIDDVIVGVYAVAGACFLFFFRHEVIRQRKSRPLFLLGFVLLFVTASLDALTNREDLLRKFFDRDQIARLENPIYYVEESAKIFGEAAFMLAFCAILLAETRTEEEHTNHTTGA